MSYLIVFICGILTSLPYIFDFLAFLPWISLVPLFVISKRKKGAYRYGLSFSMGYYITVYYWFIYLYPMDFAGFSNSESVLLILLAWLGLSLFQAVQTAFVPLIYSKLYSNKAQISAPFIAASLWCIMEWFQTKFWFGVPWARLAVSQHKLTPMIQSASLFGSLFISFIIVLVNGLLAISAVKIKHDKKIPTAAFVAVGIVLVNIFYGFSNMFLSKNTLSNSTSIKVASIQGNIASGDKWADDSLYTSLKIYSNLTEEAVYSSSAKLVVWPETVITADLNTDSEVKKAISELAVKTNAYIAVGAYYTTENNETENSIYLFHPDGTVNPNIYSKRHLVPFGEYLPMANIIKKIFPSLSEINILSDDLHAGSETKIFETELGNIGAIICFDSIYPNLTSDSVKDGAEIILLSTNDSWYLDSAAVYQHNGHAVLRAVENGKYVIRAANTGVSSIISEKGIIKEYLNPLVSGYISTEVFLNTDKTLYCYIGDLIVLLCVFYVITCVILKKIKIL